MRIGILYPGSTAHPEIAIDYMAGLKTFLRKAVMQDDVQLFTESVGFGGAEKEVYRQSEKLLMISDVDVLVAFIDLKVLPLLEPLIYASGKLVLVVNPGANYPQNWVPQPNIIFLTLQHAFLCWLSGSLPLGNNAATATSLYDCGYMHSAAMVRNFVKSGGSVNFNYINRQTNGSTYHLDELMSFLATDKKTDNLLCVFDDVPASYFYERLNTFDGAGRLHFFVSPMMLEENALNGKNAHEFSIEGYSPWLASLEHQENLEFTNYYTAQTRRPANIFSLLGWETGLILQQIIYQSAGNYFEGEEIVNKLLKTNIPGPRGELRFAHDTHHVLVPPLKCTINKNGRETETMNEIHEQWLSFVSEPCEGISSGWTNTYLCY